MNKLRFHTGVILATLAVLLVWMAAGPCSAQSASSQTEQTNTSRDRKAAQDRSDKSPPDSSTQQGQAETKITPEQAKELFRSVNEILQFVSKDTGLPIKHKVKHRLTSRDELVAYMTKHMAEDKDARRLERSEVVLKKFGLVPRDFNLKTFLVALLREQVAAYYDPKTKTVNLLDWVDPEQQKPVLAHELTHALQDQSFGL
jgi:hypothetical protein